MNMPLETGVLPAHTDGSTRPRETCVRRASLVRIALVTWVGLVASAQPVTTPAGDAVHLPVFDAHLHYNWEPSPRLAPEAVGALLRRAGVTGVLANSRPNDGTRALAGSPPAGLAVVPFLRPYRRLADVQTWFRDPSIVRFVQEEFGRAPYRGLGEFHVFGDGADTAVVRELVQWATERGLVLFAHCDTDALTRLFAHAPRARVLWAHAGFSVPEAEVARLLEVYPTLMAELSYRSGITDADGRLTDLWKSMFLRFPDRFVVGSDTWIDRRWDDYERIIDGYRAWLRQLPEGVAARIAHDNATALFRR